MLAAGSTLRRYEVAAPLGGGSSIAADPPQGLLRLPLARGFRACGWARGDPGAVAAGEPDRPRKPAGLESAKMRGVPEPTP
jgi:hypothetical protein